ncbi:MAG: HD-GYP domain-containing protein [Deltaproteobacteria bacterium]|nr:HD-GYP domain-containing protein [Deltaproteobacteria bacterium]
MDGRDELILKLSKEVERLKAQNKKIVEEALNAIIKTLEAKDKYTLGHSRRVAYYSLMVARNFSFSQAILHEIELAALLHDIGKIGTPLEILNKPSGLTDEEFEIIKQHPIHSFEILCEVSSLKNVAQWVRSHQERVDGLGYPDGLKAENIPLPSRIIAVADAFDAMTSDRPYRKAMSAELAYAELRRCAGTQFDEKTVDVFINAHQLQKMPQAEPKTRLYKHS